MTFFYYFGSILVVIRDFSMSFSIEGAYISIFIYAFLSLLLLVDISHNHFSMRKNETKENYDTQDNPLLLGFTENKVARR